MLELKAIMKRADNRTLVIGDEVCRGTEHVSGNSIVAASIINLSKVNASFIFATHLHDLCDISHIKNLENLGIYHLSVRYDIDSKKLIYDRTLQRGQGNTLYGLEVCKSLNLGEDFLEIANGIRQEILEMPESLYLQKQSRYNAQCFIDMCGICKKPAKEVHHIKHQVTADENGFIDHIHKNKLSNLVAVCEACHDKIHNNSILVEGYQQTSAGIEMITIKKEDIIKMRENGMTYKDISDKMNISIYKVRKLICL
jgi:DNA mismatch repair protein MutS